MSEKQGTYVTGLEAGAVDVLQDVWARLDELLEPVEEYQAGDIRVKDVMERYGWVWSTASNHLKQWAAEGKLTAHQVRDPESGRVVTVYRMSASGQMGE